MSDGETTPGKTRALKAPWQPGQSGNPAGRPKGSRHKFAERFIDDFLSDWEQHGAAAIATVRAEKPAVYLRAAVAVLPKQYDVTVNDIDSISDAELDARLAELEARTAAALDAQAGAAAAGDSADKPARVH